MNKEGTLSQGEIIGGCYRVDDIVASGGMGTVYRVFHTSLNRTLALKTLKTNRISKESWSAFVTEAKVLSRLEHPNLVKVYDLGLIENRLPYFVMDYIDGEPLSNKIKREGALPVALTLAIFEQVADGLSYAQEINLLHRDIKPGNIMLQKTQDKNQPLVKIVDFGLATEAAGASSEINQKICGSPPYMSPEQSLYQNLDSRSDMYSLGCSLFEALTGAPPFIGESALITLSKHQTEKPPTLKEASLGTVFAPVLERMVAKMLAKQPENRIQSFSELKQIIKKMRQLEQDDKLHSEVIPVNAKPQQQKNEKAPIENEPGKSLPRGLIAALCILVLLGTVGGFIYLKSSSSKTTVPANTQAISSKQLIKKLALTSDDRSQIEDEKLCGDNKARLYSDFYRRFPFSESRTIDGHTSFILNFPRTISAGTVAVLNESNEVLEPQPAQGSLIMDGKREIYFKPDKSFTASQSVFRAIKADDLTVLDLSNNLNVTTATPSMFDHLTRLEELNLNDTAIGDATIADLSKLTYLKSLKVDRTDITGDGLCKLKQLDTLRSLQISVSFQLDRLLDKLKSSTALNTLKIHGTPVAAHELTLLAQTPHLQELTLDETNTVGKDLLVLKTAPELTSLTLAHQLYEPGIQSILSQLPNLKRLTLSMGSWSASDRAAFGNALKGIAVSDLDASTQSAP